MSCSDHAQCSKKKAENECFINTTRKRFIKRISEWKIDVELKSDIFEVIEFFLMEANEEVVQGYSNLKVLNYCESIEMLNELQKTIFYKISYFVECLEKSKLSLAHIHRIKVFLQTKIFYNLPLQKFLEEIMSLIPLYECRTCRVSAPVDSSVEELTEYFYVSVRTLCKECFKAKNKENYELKKEIKSVSGPMIKMYLCMTCGEDNYVNFYERNKSKCKFCILSEKRGINSKSMKHDKSMNLNSSNSKSHFCEECHTEDPKNFRDTYKSLCYACFLERKKQSYAQQREIVPKDPPKIYCCKDCETVDPTRFRKGYKSQCYNCFLEEKKRERANELLKNFGFDSSISKSDSNENVEVVEELVESNQKFESKSKRYVPKNLLCKHCNTTNPIHFNEGMETSCAKCEEIDMQTFQCSKCNSECFRNCFVNPPEDFLELMMNEMNEDGTLYASKLICNVCDPEAYKLNQRKEHNCACGEKDMRNFYLGFKSKCKKCTREERRLRYEARERTLKPYLCSECGTTVEKDFYLGHKTKCKHCM